MGAPQIVWIFLVALGLGVQIAKHGQPQSPYHAGKSLVGCAISVGLLYWGGFFHG